MFLKDEETETFCRAGDVCHGNLQSMRQRAEVVNGGAAGLERFDHSSGKDHRAGGGARYLAEREGSCSDFGERL